MRSVGLSAKPSPSSSAPAAAFIRPKRTRPSGPTGSRPRKTFSATVIAGTGLSSCSTMATPAASASSGPSKRTSRPRTRIVPASRRRSPMRIDRKVDLPAPLPPQSACTEPARSRKRPSLSAATPPKDLRRPSASSSGVSKRTPPRRRPAAGPCARLPGGGGPGKRAARRGVGPAGPLAAGGLPHDATSQVFMQWSVWSKERIPASEPSPVATSPAARPGRSAPPSRGPCRGGAP